MSDTATPVVLITGAAGGIGAATADHLLSISHRIIAIDRDEDALNKIYAGYGDDKVAIITADISDVDQIRSATSRGIAHFGSLNALVNNAALHGQRWLRPCLDYSPDEWAEIFAVNVFAIPAFAKAALPALIKSQGVIINMSSMTGYGHGSPSAYSVSKTAVNGLTTSLSDELGELGVRVVGLAPGFIATPAVIASVSEIALERVLERQAIQTTGKPEDIAKIVAFLIRDEARLITGTTIHADLGTTRLS